MSAFTHHSIRFCAAALGAALGLAPPALAGDVSVRLDENSGFVVEDHTGGTQRLRVDEATGNLSRNGALFVHTTGAPNNLFLGAGAGNTNISGSGGNTAVGYGSTYTNTTGSQNSAFGVGSLHSNTTGSRNSAFGAYALDFNTTGSRNVAIGQYAGQSQTTGSDNIYLANVGVAAESGKIRIGTNLTHTAAFIAGIHGATVGGSGVPVFVNPNGQLGTGGVAGTTLTGDVNASDNDITGVRRLAFGPVLEAGGGFSVDMPNSTGYGFTIASAESPLSGGIGVARDTTATIGFNWNESGTNAGSPFNPTWGLSFENSFPTAGWPMDSVQEFHWISASGRTTGTVANGTGFAPHQVIVVEEPGNGPTVGIGLMKTIGAGPNATAVIDWIYSAEASTNPPSLGDTMERESSTTVTSRTGTFSMQGGGLWVYASPTCGPDGETATAILGLSSIANQSGTSADLVFVRSEGPGASVVEGNCVRQSITGATALLGPVAIAASTTFTSTPYATNDGAWRPMTTIFSPHGQAMASSWFGNRTLMDTGIPTLKIGTLQAGETGHWLGIASSVIGPGGNDYVGAIGSPTADENFGIWGRWWIFEPGGFDHVSLGAAAVTGTRMQNFADVDGTLAAFTALTGCADDAPVVASGSTGGIKCGAPSFAQDFSLPEDTARTSPTLVVREEVAWVPPLLYPEPAPRLREEMKKQRRTIEAQQQEIAALTKRLARVEAFMRGQPDQTPRRK